MESNEKLYRLNFREFSFSVILTEYTASSRKICFRVHEIFPKHLVWFKIKTLRYRWWQRAIFFHQLQYGWKYSTTLRHCGHVLFEFQRRKFGHLRIDNSHLAAISAGATLINIFCCQTFRGRGPFVAGPFSRPDLSWPDLFRGRTFRRRISRGRTFRRRAFWGRTFRGRTLRLRTFWGWNFRGRMFCRCTKYKNYIFEITLLLCYEEKKVTQSIDFILDYSVKIYNYKARVYHL